MLLLKYAKSTRCNLSCSLLICGSSKHAYKQPVAFVKAKQVTALQLDHLHTERVQPVYKHDYS